MIQESLASLFERDLTKLATEINAYSNEKIIWQIQDGILNSGGNLSLHLIGNLKQFIGKTLGNIDFEREREKEFTNTNIPIAVLIAEINITKEIVVATLQKLPDHTLETIYPINVFNVELTTTQFLIHLYGHLNYHLGQINYHRRMLDV
jgi:Protein of unknown function (DUF1572)